MSERKLSVLLIGNLKDVNRHLIQLQKELQYTLSIQSIAQDKLIADRCVADLKPDFILLEVSGSFPVWDFMDEVHNNLENTEILLITKEKNFESAYQAFQHRALNFLLEPVNKETLLQNLEEVNRKLLIISEARKDREKLNLYELKQHQEMMEKILTNMLEKPEELETLLYEINHRYQTQISIDSFQALVVNTDKRELYIERNGFCQKVLHIIEDSFPKAHEVISAVVMPYGITGIINFTIGLEQEISRKDMNQLHQSILDLQEEYGAFDLVIGVGITVHSMKDINQSLQEAFRAEQYKLVYPEQKIFYAFEFPKRKETGAVQILLDSQKKNLTRFLRRMDGVSIEQWIDEMVDKAEDNFKDYPEGYNLLKDEILMTAKEVWCDSESAEYFVEQDSAFQELSHCFQGRKMLVHLKEILLSICKRRRESKNTELNTPIKTALDYIGLHYKEAVTLEELADISGLSPNYFSSMFKEQVGETYIDYLTELRLMQAKELLLTTHRTVKEIANEIGYLDDKYFRKLFKNRFGVIPSQFRKN